MEERGWRRGRKLEEVEERWRKMLEEEGDGVEGRKTEEEEGLRGTEGGRRMEMRKRKGIEEEASGGKERRMDECGGWREEKRAEDEG